MSKKNPSIDADGAKKGLSVQQFLDQFNALDPNNYGSWPKSVKITCWVFIVAFIGALGYFTFISSVIEEGSLEAAKETVLLNEYRDKESKLRNLERYQTQLDSMRLSFNKQLQQLPKESEIPGLVEDINRTGVKAGLKLKNIRLEKEIEQDFFVEQPIFIEATGDYHAFAQFTSDLAVLPRIVTLHDFTVTASPSSNQKTDVPELNYMIKAKTYRYLGDSHDKDGEDKEVNATGSSPVKKGP